MAFEVLKAKVVTPGVFENNQAAYHCYKAAGSRDVQMEKSEYYHAPVRTGNVWNYEKKLEG